MIDTARTLVGIAGKTIVRNGALQPATLKHSDAEFSVGFALAATQSLPPGVYVAMNGRISDPATARKARAEGRFVDEHS